jgi:hypothetical protein
MIVYGFTFRNSSRKMPESLRLHGIMCASARNEMLRHHNNELNWKSHEMKKQQHSQNRVIENLIHQYFDLDNVKEHQ